MKSLFSNTALFSLPAFIAGCCPYRTAGEWGNWPMMNYGFGHGGMFMGMIFLIIVAVASYFIIQSAISKGAGSQVLETPLDILKKRYAKGEITKEQFEQMKKDLE